MTKKMKGMELPINLLVIVAVAVIVLLGVVALFLTGFQPIGETLTSSGSAKNNACSQWIGTGCTIAPESILIYDYDANDDKDEGSDAGSSFDWPDWDANENWNDVTNEDDNLAALCAYHYGADTEDECRAICGCN